MALKTIFSSNVNLNLLHLDIKYFLKYETNKTGLKPIKDNLI